MTKYQQLIAKIKELQNNNPCFNHEITQAEWIIIEEALMTIQFLEVIFTVRTKNLKPEHE